MSLAGQFSLSFELSRIPELVPVIANAINDVVDFARELRKSGSDIVVEQDLATVFLQNRIEAKFAETFKHAVVPTDVASPFRALPIYFMRGAGPTVRRALRNQAYFSMVVQLSMLCATHEIISLSEGLFEALRLRLRGAPTESDSTFSPESLSGVLTACSEQTASFPWHGYLAHISQALGVPYGNDYNLPRPPGPNDLYTNTEHYNNYYSLSVPLLQASLDMLAAVQSLYKDNIMFIDGSRGCCTMVLWAHYVLGHTVRIEGCPNGTVTFGAGEHNVIIVFEPPKTTSAAVPFGNRPVSKNEQPCIYLMDATAMPRLKIQRDDEEAGVEIVADLKIPARGYGESMFAEKLDGESERIDMGHVTSGMALLFSEHIMDEAGEGSNQRLLRMSCASNISSVLKASAFILGDTLFDARKARYYRDAYEGQGIDAIRPPPSLQVLSKTVVSWELLRARAYDLALVILAFSAVGNLNECESLVLGPLTNIHTIHISTRIMNWDGRSPLPVDHRTWYMLIAHLLCGRKDVDLHDTFLYSNWGWSVYVDSLGSEDPTLVTPGKIWIKYGTPHRNGDYAHSIKNGPYKVTHTIPQCSSVESADQILRPRCMTSVSMLPFLVALRADTFVVSVRYKTDIGTCLIGYGDLHRLRWEAQILEPCSHRVANEEHPLDIGITSVRGMMFDPLASPSERICVSMVRGSGPARWLALAGNPAYNPRESVLRGSSTCLECSIQQIVIMKGDQLLIL
jgi:hypothetical protein